MNLKKNLLSDNRGMTMTEVLMAFLVLIIMMGMLSGIVAFSKKMYMNAADLRRAQSGIQKSIYRDKFLNDYKGSGVTSYLPVYKVTQDGSQYKVELLHNGNYDGNSSETESSSATEEALSGGIIEVNETLSANNISCVTFSQGVAQESLSGFLSEEAGETEEDVTQLETEEDVTQLFQEIGEYSSMSFLVFKKDNYEE